MSAFSSQRTSLCTVEESFATDLSNRLEKHEIQQDEGGFTECAFSLRACLDTDDDGEILEALRRRHTCDSVPVVDRGYIPDDYEHALQSAGLMSGSLSDSELEDDQPHHHGAGLLIEQHLQEASDDELFARKQKQQALRASHLLKLPQRHSCGSGLYALGGRPRRPTSSLNRSSAQTLNTSQSQGFLGDIGAELSCSTSQLVWSRARRLTESGSIHSSVNPSSPRVPSSSPFTCTHMGLSPLNRTSPTSIFARASPTSSSPFLQESHFNHMPNDKLVHSQLGPVVATVATTQCKACHASLHVQSGADSDDTCSALTAYEGTAYASMTSMRSSASSEPLQDEQDISVRLPSMDLLARSAIAQPGVEICSQAEDALDAMPQPQLEPILATPVPATFADQCLIM